MDSKNRLRRASVALAICCVLFLLGTPVWAESKSVRMQRLGIQTCETQIDDLDQITGHLQKMQSALEAMVRELPNGIDFDEDALVVDETREALLQFEALALGRKDHILALCQRFAYCGLRGAVIIVENTRMFEKGTLADQLFKAFDRHKMIMLTVPLAGAHRASGM